MSIDEYIINKSSDAENFQPRAIPDYKHKGDSFIKDANISSDIEIIGTQAFYNCSSLENANLPEGLKHICASAFSGCRNIREIRFPKTLTTIERNAFSNCLSIKKLDIPDNVTEIGENCFSGCSDLKKVKLPIGIKKLPASLFAKCHSLKKIKIPEGVENIEKSVFESCYDLNSIKFPSTLESINSFCFAGSRLTHVTLPQKLEKLGNGVFLDCMDLTKIKFNDNLQEIGESAFKNCKRLKKVEIPNNIQRIENSTFANCILLRSVKIPNVKVVSEKSFANCERLTDIKIPETTTVIGNNAFFRCIDLTSINLPDSILQIDYSAFEKCLTLKNVELPKHIKSINESLFRECRSLESVKIYDEVVQIQRHAFQNCDKLTNISLPKNLEVIGEEAFSGCEKLKEIEIPLGVKIIEQATFYNCKELKTIKLSHGLEVIKQDAFRNCISLKSIVVPSTVKIVEKSAFSNCHNLEDVYFTGDISNVKDIGEFKYFTKTENGFCLSKNEKQNSIKLSDLKINPAVLSKCWKHKDVILKEQNNPEIAKFYDKLYVDLPEDLANNFAESHNFTFFKKFNFNVVYTSLEEMYKVMYNLGVFSKPVKINGKTIDYAQKTTEFLLLQIEKKNLYLGDLSFWGKDMKIGGLNPEFTDFFIENFERLKINEGVKKGFIARCYNEFKEVQKTNTSNRGSQRQLKATVDKFEDFFRDNKFSGINDTNRHIKDAISPYTSNQTDFDRAVAIDIERKENGVPNNIVGKHLVGDKFKSIDIHSNGIVKLQAETLYNLTQTVNEEFTYDWLEKNDPQNFILGKLCSCCSHLSGVGYGIMRASIIHPDVQNLVIRNEENEIVAKSTLYINREQGYGVFNNFEINTKVPDESKSKIYEQYIEAIKVFVNEYNIQNKDKPLTKINVGMGLNDLSQEIIKNAKKSLEVLPSVDYGLFSQNGSNYHGDSLDEQYTIWEKGE